MVLAFLRSDVLSELRSRSTLTSKTLMSESEMRISKYEDFNKTKQNKMKLRADATERNKTGEQKRT